MTLPYFGYNKKRWFVPIVTIFASYNTYAYYLMRREVVVNYTFVSIALGVVILIVIKDLVDRLYSKKPVY